jgi:uncharacterized damage-inducible protein DinB
MSDPSLDDQEERAALIGALDYQRASVLAVADGLAEDLWHTSVVPSGWTAAGIIEHLGGAERHWFQEIVVGTEMDLPWDEGLPPYDPFGAMVCERPSADIVAYYRAQCQRSNDVIGRTSLTAAPVGIHRSTDHDQPSNLREIMLHMIEETAAHSGHLEIGRELLDGQTRLGLR